MSEKQNLEEYSSRQKDAYAIGNRIYAARKATGMTQTELYIASGVPYKTISAIENGRQIPKVSTVIALARALRCPLSVLQPEDLDVYTNCTPDVWRVVEKLAQEKPADRRKTCEVILRFLASK